VKDLEKPRKTSKNKGIWLFGEGIWGEGKNDIFRVENDPIRRRMITKACFPLLVFGC
jgi:hypothetical protein